MASLLLAIIYLAFISLGIPDSLLGAAWPEMHRELEVSISAMGIISMLISSGTIISSLFVDKLLSKFSTAAVVIVSIGLTSVGLIGFSFAPWFWVLCLFAIPYGLGAGAIDAALNNYVALHYNSRHMSWLHCFWGVGAVISPYIMSYALGTEHGWSHGYRIVGFIQILIIAVMVATLPVWKRAGHTSRQMGEDDEVKVESRGIIGSLKIKGVGLVLLGFFAYCAAEATVMLWASSYFYEAKNADAELAAALGSLFFIGMTVGRFLAGFISDKVGDKNMIRFGLLLSFVGIVMIAIPAPLGVSIFGFVLVGLGFAPVYPSIIHSTPANFGKENSQSIIGIQMASAYVGATFMPPLFGVVASLVSIELMPFYMLVFAVLCFVMMELLNKQVKE